MFYKSIVFFFTIFTFSNLAIAQNDDPLFYRDNNPVRGNKIGWYYGNEQAGNTYPALSVYGENGGTALYCGYNKKGTYLILNNKPMLWDGKNLTKVLQIPEDLSNRKPDTVSITPLILPDGTRNPNFQPGFDIGDILLPFPCGHRGKLTWAYPAGTVTQIFPIVWIEGSGKAIYHGDNYTYSYFTDTKTTQLLQWDGNNLVPVDKLPQNLIGSRDDFIKNTSDNNYTIGDPFFPEIVNSNSQIAWYYPRDRSDLKNSVSFVKYPRVWLYEKDSTEMNYQGYDINGSYLTFKNGNYRWDGENIQKIDKVPEALFNKNTGFIFDTSKIPGFFNLDSVNQGGDLFMPGYTFYSRPDSVYLQTEEIEWDYVNGGYSISQPTIYGSPDRPFMHNEFNYHGYDEQGSYITFGGNDADFLWNGIELIPIQKVPANLYNAPPGEKMDTNIATHTNTSTSSIPTKKVVARGVITQSGNAYALTITETNGQKSSHLVIRPFIPGITKKTMEQLMPGTTGQWLEQRKDGTYKLYTLSSDSSFTVQSLSQALGKGIYKNK